jgi:hypothetical protein
MSSALLGGSTAILASPLATTPVALLPVIATTVSTDQSLSIGPLGNGTVSVRESASAGGYAVSLVDSAGAGATVPLWTATSAGGPPITSATVTASAPISLASALQCGTGTLAAGTQTITNASVTASSVILATPTGQAINAQVALSVTAGAGSFVVNGPTGSTATYNWFVAKF